MIPLLIISTEVEYPNRMGSHTFSSIVPLCRTIIWYQGCNLPPTYRFLHLSYRYKIANLLLWNPMYAQMFPKSPHLTSRMQYLAKKRDPYTCSTSVKLPTSSSGITCTNVLSISLSDICGAISLPNWVLWLGCHLSLEKRTVPATWATSVLSLPVFTYRGVRGQRSL